MEQLFTITKTTLNLASPYLYKCDHFDIFPPRLVVYPLPLKCSLLYTWNIPSHLALKKIYRNSSLKPKQRSSKSLHTTFLCYSNAKSTLSSTFNRVEKINLESSVLLIFFLLLSSFFFHRHNRKSIWSLQILNILSDCSANLLHSYYFWALCEVRVRVMAQKLSLSRFAFACVRTLLGFSHI